MEHIGRGRPSSTSCTSSASASSLQTSSTAGGPGCTAPSAEDVAAVLRRMALAGLAEQMPEVSFDTDDAVAEAKAEAAASALTARLRRTVDPVAVDQDNVPHQRAEGEAALVARLRRRLGVTATDWVGHAAGGQNQDPGPPVEGHACEDDHDSVMAQNPVDSVAHGKKAEFISNSALQSAWHAWMSDFCAAASSRSSSPADEADDAQADAAAQALVTRLHRIVDFVDEDLQDCPRAEDEAALSARLRFVCASVAASRATASQPEVEVAVATVHEAKAAEGGVTSECDDFAWLFEVDWDRIKAMALQKGLGSGVPIRESMLAKTITPIISILDAIGGDVKGRARSRSSLRGGRRKYAVRFQRVEDAAGSFAHIHAQSQIQWRQPSPASTVYTQSQMPELPAKLGQAWPAAQAFAKIKWRNTGPESSQASPAAQAFAKIKWRNTGPESSKCRTNTSLTRPAYAAACSTSQPSECNSFHNTERALDPFAWIPGAPGDPNFHL